MIVAAGVVEHHSMNCQMQHIDRSVSVVVPAAAAAAGADGKVRSEDETVVGEVTYDAAGCVVDVEA